MAERVIVVCDVCGKTPADTVGITAKGKAYGEDLCNEHLAKLLNGARASKRGRPARAQATSAPAHRGRPPKAASQNPAGHPAPASTETAKRERKKITDPVILGKRRAALVKARQARADKRLAAKR